MEQETRMKILIEQIRKASYAYYVLDNPVMSDMQWDQLYDELRKLQDETGVILNDSPTRQVGGAPLKGFEEHRHISRLWSMDKVQNFDALRGWIERTEKLAGKKDLQYYLEYKFDGLTLNLTYQNGQLIQAATRGNGIVGEAILPQARTIFTIPERIPYNGILEVQGECIMRLSTLQKYNQSSAEPLKNARNAAAGALRNLDPAVTASRHLDAFFYQVGTIDNPPYRTQPEMIDFLRENGFQTSPYLGKGKGIKELEKCIQQISDHRNELDWLIDGVVIKIGDVDLREQLGFTEKFPRWAVAYKFKAQESVTRLNNVSWELGRTGKLTPVATVQPVDFYGVTVCKATLNNWDDICRKKLRTGCNVWIRRSNDVIPEIMGRTEEVFSDESDIIKPTICPDCGGELTERGAHIFCLNRQSCRSQAIMRLSHYASRDAMDIDGFSEKTAGTLYDLCAVRDPADMYRLLPMDFLQLDGFKERKAFKLFESIEKSKRCSLDSFLYAIGIPNVGKKTARDLANHFKTLDVIREATIEELMEIQDVGRIVAESVTEFFCFDENKDMIKRLIESGVEPRLISDTYQSGPFKGMSIVVTGTLPNLTRKQAEQMIIQAGGSPSGSVSKRTAFVVAGDAAGSKLAKAQNLSIEVIDENELIRRARMG